MKRTTYKDHEVYIDPNPIYVTDNYEIFEHWPGNRPVLQKDVNPIKESILSQGWMWSSILLVGPNMWLGDGQHRHEALQQIKKETGKTWKIRFQVDEKLTLQDIIKMNSTSTKWNVYSHLFSQCARGNIEYIKLRDYMRKYQFSAYSAVMLARGLANTGKDFKIRFEAGDFKADNWELANVRAENLLKIKKYFDKALSSHFIKAMLVFWRHPEYNNDTFVHKLELNRSMAYPCATVDQYKEMIKKLYNYKNQRKIKFI